MAIPQLDDKWDDIRKFLNPQFSGWWACCCVVGAFLTRLPFPAVKGGEKKGALFAAAKAFPLIGCLVGIIAGLALMIAAKFNLHPLAYAFIGLAAAALVTGALHEDGLADLADGFGGGATKTEKLKIMKDSRIGAFGVLALVFSVGIRAAILGGLPGPGMAAVALIAAGALSRALLPAVMGFLDPARKSGLAAKAGVPDDEGWVTALVLGVLLAFLCLGFWGGVLALVFSVAAVAAVGWLAERQIGGVTGDVLGAQQQMAEIAVLVAAAASL
ncbi:MAG: adenosylcobinamide-GDP ribazoletransferase [Rhodospirillales bacterium]|nr:adenosylcobinamide-GDP ribazoletransferase [Rhodospirillales bacterium]